MATRRIDAPPVEENNSCPEGYYFDAVAQACTEFPKELDGVPTDLYEDDSVKEYLEYISQKEFEKATAEGRIEELRSSIKTLEDVTIPAEKVRVENVRKNVIPEARKLDKADDWMLKKHNLMALTRSDAYDAYLNAKNPIELKKAIDNLPEELKAVLPNRGQYSIATYDKAAEDWKPGVGPDRELFCTPYGCEVYRRAGASDLPYIGGNVGFVNPEVNPYFEKISNEEKQPGDVQVLSTYTKKDFTNPKLGKAIRPHHTTIYTEGDIEDGEVSGYNARQGTRLMWDESSWDTATKEEIQKLVDSGQEEDLPEYPEYYRYIGQTKRLQNQLNQQRQELEDLTASLEMSRIDDKDIPALVKALMDIENLPIREMRSIDSGERGYLRDAPLYVAPKKSFNTRLEQNVMDPARHKLYQFMKKVGFNPYK